jgi:chlorophyllide a reductase subunit Y
MPEGIRSPTGGDGMGCHAGAAEMEKAARMAGKSEILDQYAKDYPQGPHDKPQSMCPAFGSLRVGLRMRRVATVLSGSACCVYGLTFVSHFYGARRSVGYVPFNSETLVTGKLFEDIRDAVHEMADPERYDAIVVTNLCVPTASGVPLRLLPDEINGVRIVGIDVPGFGVPTHAEAKDVLAGAMLNYARQEVEAGPVQAPVSGKSDRPTVTLLGEMFPADPLGIGGMLAPLGLAAGPVVPCREWRELYAALDSEVVAAIHPFYTAPFASSRPRAAPSWAPPRRTRRHRRLACRDRGRLWRRRRQGRRRAECLPARHQGRASGDADQGHDHAIGLRGLGASGRAPADRKRGGHSYVGSACPKTKWSAPDVEWLEARGVKVKFRASLEDDCAAMEAIRPDLAIGTTPVVQKGKELGIPSLYFTNLISARPLMGPMGAGSLQQVVNAAMGNKDRMDHMKAFFEGVGEGDTAGIWEGAPNLRPDFRATNLKKLEKAEKARIAANGGVKC